jgi:hypothetical protein
MAARNRKVALTDDWKANIQATQIMNRLYGHALGTVDMEKSQIDACKIVLAKILPDLKAMELSGPDGGPVQVAGTFNVNFKGVDKR